MRYPFHLVHSAKRIYFIQRIHWKNFQVWVLTRNSSWKNFSMHVIPQKSDNHDFSGWVLRYCGRKKKNSTFWFCSHFMSFCPIYSIFIGWIAEIWEFFWVPRNFDFKPTNEIFSQKRIFLNFQKRPFLGVSCRKLIFWKIGFIDTTFLNFL